MIMTKDNLRKLNAEIDMALKSVGEKFGVSIQTRQTTYRDAGGTIKLQFNNLDDTTGEPMIDKMHELMAKQACSVAMMIGDLPKDFNPDLGIIGCTFNHPFGGKITVVDYKPSMKKYPFIYTNFGKKGQYKGTVQILKGGRVG